MPVLDGIGSLVIGLLLGSVSVLLAYESRALLLGESARPEVLEGIREITLGEAGVEEMGLPLTMHFGPDEVLLNMEVRFRSDLRAEDLMETVARVEAGIRAAYPQFKRIFIKTGFMKGSPGPWRPRTD